MASDRDAALVRTWMSDVRPERATRADVEQAVFSSIGAAAHLSDLRSALWRETDEYMRTRASAHERTHSVRSRALAVWALLLALSAAVPATPVLRPRAFRYQDVGTVLTVAFVIVIVLAVVVTLLMRFRAVSNGLRVLVTVGTALTGVGAFGVLRTSTADSALRTTAIIAATLAVVMFVSATVTSVLDRRRAAALTAHEAETDAIRTAFVVEALPRWRERLLAPLAAGGEIDEAGADALTEAVLTALRADGAVIGERDERFGDALLLSLVVGALPWSEQRRADRGAAIRDGRQPLTRLRDIGHDVGRGADSVV